MERISHASDESRRIWLKAQLAGRAAKWHVRHQSVNLGRRSACEESTAKWAGMPGEKVGEVKEMKEVEEVTDLWSTRRVG